MTFTILLALFSVAICSDTKELNGRISYQKMLDNYLRDSFSINTWLMAPDMTWDEFATRQALDIDNENFMDSIEEHFQSRRMDTAQAVSDVVHKIFDGVQSFFNGESSEWIAKLFKMHLVHDTMRFFYEDSIETNLYDWLDQERVLIRRFHAVINFVGILWQLSYKVSFGHAELNSYLERIKVRYLEFEIDEMSESFFLNLRKNENTNVGLRFKRNILPDLLDLPLQIKSSVTKIIFLDDDNSNIVDLLEFCESFPNLVSVSLWPLVPPNQFDHPILVKKDSEFIKYFKYYQKYENLL